MLEIGQFNELEILKEVDFGLYLDGGPYGEILLPKSYTTDDMNVGDDVSVFLYNDSEDRLIATTKEPKIVCGTFACLQVKEVASVGAFMDWGLDGKDLLVPFSEQRFKMQAGEWHVVCAYLDEDTERIVGSSKLHEFFDSHNENFEVGQEVEITFAYRTPLGIKVIIEHSHLGMLYRNELFKQVLIGQKSKAYIKTIREDNLIDLSLQRQGYLQQIPDACRAVIAKLEEAEGFLPIHDKSDPRLIQEHLAMSKKAFKKAIGYLYKNQIIVLKDNGIELKK